MIIAEEVEGLEEAKLSFVKRSLTALSCKSGGSMMWTSGSLHRGSWIPATLSGLRTTTGTDCTIVVSRS